MKTEITILWGNDKVKKTYVFEDETQKAFFMKGVDEAEGWLKYEVVENEQLYLVSWTKVSYTSHS